MAYVRSGIRQINEGDPLFLLSRCTVVAAAVADIAPVRLYLDTGCLALLTYRAIVFHAGGLLVFFIHGE